MTSHCDDVSVISSSRVMYAYNGGCKGTCVLKWLVNSGYEVYAMIANIGGVTESSILEAKDRALVVGASKVFVEDLRHDFLTNYVYQSIRANALYDGKLPLGLALGRPCIAKRQIELARREQCPYVAHGALSLNSDHCRFELAYYALDANIKIVSPTRDRILLEITRDEEALKRFIYENKLDELGTRPLRSTPDQIRSCNDANDSANTHEVIGLRQPTGDSNLFTRTHIIHDDPSQQLNENHNRGRETSASIHNIQSSVPEIEKSVWNVRLPLWTVNPVLRQSDVKPEYVCVAFAAGRLYAVYHFHANEEPGLQIGLDAISSGLTSIIDPRKAVTSTDSTTFSNKLSTPSGALLVRDPTFTELARHPHRLDGEASRKNLVFTPPATSEASGQLPLPSVTVQMFQLLNAIGARQGVGRVDMMVNAQIGVKYRYLVEFPGGSILQRAHEDLEGFIMDREVRRLRDMLSHKFSELAYNGFWYSPEMDFITTAVAHSQEAVEGVVLLRVHNGSIMPLDRFSRIAESCTRGDTDSCSGPRNVPSGSTQQGDITGYIRCASARLRCAAASEKL